MKLLCGECKGSQKIRAMLTDSNGGFFNKEDYPELDINQNISKPDLESLKPCDEVIQKLFSTFNYDLECEACALLNKNNTQLDLAF